MPEAPKPQNKKGRKLVNPSIYALALCNKGANGFGVVYKHDVETEDGNTEQQDGFLPVLINKEGIEKGELLAVAYAPGVVDAHGDFADIDAVKMMAYSFAKNKGYLDLQHDGAPLPPDKAYIAESFIVQASDDRFSNYARYDGKKVDLTGAWAVVVKLEDPALRKIYKERNWNGVSMFGFAESTPKKKELQMDENTIKQLVADAVAAAISPLAKSLAESNKRAEDAARAAMLGTVSSEVLAKAGITDADTTEVVGLKLKLAKATVEPEAKVKAKATLKKSRPIFKGDIGNGEELAAFAYICKRFDIEAQADATDPDSLIKAAEDLSALALELPEQHAKFLEKQKAAKSVTSGQDLTLDSTTPNEAASIEAQANAIAKMVNDNNGSTLSTLKLAKVS